MKKTSGIYKIQSISHPERMYIGSAKDIRRRWWDHKRYLKENRHHSGKLQNHYNKYGETDLTFAIIVGCEVNQLIAFEQFYIDSFNPYFNICKIAASTLGRPSWSKGTKGIKKASNGSFKKGHIGYWTGKKRPEESKRLKNGTMPEEQKEKIRQSMLGKKNAFKKVV